MTNAPKLPADLSDALTKWANDKGLTRDEAAAAVRAALPVPDNFEPGLSTVTGEGQVITTRVEHVTVAFQTPPARFSEALEYSNNFHPDGRMATADDGDAADLTRARLTAGETRRISKWTWTAGPRALVGVHLDNVPLFPGREGE